jgi:hypothetical protein
MAINESTESMISKFTKEFNAQETKGDTESATEETKQAEDQSQNESAQDQQADDGKNSQPDLQQDDLTGEYEKDVPKEFHKHPRWQKIHAEAKQAKELKSKLEELVGKRFNSEDLTEDDINEILESRGLLNQKSDSENQSEKQESPKYDLENLTKEQRNIVNFLDFYVGKKLDPLQGTLKQQASFLASIQQKEYEKSLMEDEKKTQKWVTEDLKLDWDKTVAPGVKKMLEENYRKDKNWGAGLTPMQVTRLWLTDHLLGQGKKLGIAESQKLNEQKKAKLMETDKTNASDSKIDYSKMKSPEELVSTALKEARMKFSP